MPGSRLTGGAGRARRSWRRLIDLLRERFPEIEEKELHARVLCGEVEVNGEKVAEPARAVPRDSRIAFRGGARFVSRGGEKLDPILDLWRLPVEGKVFLDAGSSRGGFTHALLQRGARRVYAVDVGYNQLDYRLRRDPRVIVLERTNLMELDAGRLAPRPQAAVADLSFRSLERAAARLLELAEEGWAVALVKPQFEWARPDPGFRGVVTRREDHRRILADLLRRLWAEGSYVTRAARSPLPGRRGNVEFFFLLERRPQADPEAMLRELEFLLGAADAGPGLLP